MEHWRGMMSNTKIMDAIQLSIINLEETMEAFRIIQKRQAILLNILQRKLEVSDGEILEEERRLNAELSKSKKSTN